MEDTYIKRLKELEKLSISHEVRDKDTLKRLEGLEEFRAEYTGYDLEKISKLVRGDEDLGVPNIRHSVAEVDNRLKELELWKQRAKWVVVGLTVNGLGSVVLWLTAILDLNN